ncbi:hypothetical protein Barb7_03074 [Bacteroidales bacterium Barb7]|nr:hypothetical protein Barb7_03074 [Bacteroidales bacterium Barb7]
MALTCKPGIFAVNPPPREGALAAVSSVSVILVVEYPCSLLARNIPPAVTTTSSNTLTSAPNAMFSFGLMATSVVFIPTYETTSVVALAGTFGMLKFPSKSVILPIFVPFTNTAAPITGKSSSFEMTTPDTFRDCATNNWNPTDRNVHSNNNLLPITLHI